MHTEKGKEIKKRRKNVVQQNQTCKCLDSRSGFSFLPLALANIYQESCASNLALVHMV